MLEAYAGSNAGSSTYIFDPNGSLSSIVSGTPASLFLYGPLFYDAYGLTINNQTNPYLSAVPFQYKGQAGYVSDIPSFDSTAQHYGHTFTGLINCFHRWYDPAAGRWISRDPAGLEGGENQYEYCNDSPLTNADPSGLSVTSGIDGAGYSDAQIRSGFQWCRAAKNQVLGSTRDFGDSWSRYEMGTESGWAVVGYGALAGFDVLSVALDFTGVGEEMQAARMSAQALNGYRFEEKIRKIYGLKKQQCIP